MFASVLASLALLAPLAAAEVIVNVGVNNSLLFDPPQVFTEPGETITFVFQSNHTATLSTFEDPCTAVEGGFDTGFLSNNQTASVRVNGTDPIWMYCRVGMHCEYGMVFAVNPTPSQPYEFFNAKAKLLLNATTPIATNATNATSTTVVAATSPTANTFTFATATAATSAATDAATPAVASAATSAASTATSAVASAAVSATDAATSSASAATSAVTAAATDSAATSSAAATTSAAASSAAATTSAAASLGAAPRVGLAGASDAVTSFSAPSVSASATDAFAAVTTVAGETPVVIVVEKETELKQAQRRTWMQREVAFAR